MERDKLNPSDVFVGLIGSAVALLGIMSPLVWSVLPDWLALKLALLFALPLFSCAMVYYYFVLRGGEWPQRSYWRVRYDELQDDLESGGGFELTYSRWLGRALDWLDGFMGDREADPESRLAREMGVATRGPAWTAAAYDRCLLLALVYPVASMFLVWAWAGHQGVAEQAFGLPSGDEVEAWRRGFLVTATIPLIFAARRFASVERLAPRTTIAWILAFDATVAATIAIALLIGRTKLITIAIANAIAFPVALGGSFAFAGAFAVALTVATTGAYAVGAALAVAVAGALPFAVVSAFGVALAVAVAAIGERSEKRERGGLFLGLFSVVFACVCYSAAWNLGGEPGWDLSGALPLFLGLLTLINAPFDWFAIGLTRWLLRKGLARQGLWPLVFAGLDAVAAAISVAALAFVCVAAVQFYGDLAVHHATTVLHAKDDSARIIHFAEQFDSLANHGTDYKNWWIWLMLFSTAIPSVANLFIACFSILRGMPWLGRWMRRQLRDGGETPEPVKIGLAAILSLQITLGALATAWLMYELLTLVGPLVFPIYAGWLLDTSHWLADCNTPAHVARWWAGYGWGASCW